MREVVDLWSDWVAAATNIVFFTCAAQYVTSSFLHPCNYVCTTSRRVCLNSLCDSSPLRNTDVVTFISAREISSVFMDFLPLSIAAYEKQPPNTKPAHTHKSKNVLCVHAHNLVFRAFMFLVSNVNWGCRKCPRSGIVSADSLFDVLSYLRSVLTIITQKHLPVCGEMQLVWRHEVSAGLESSSAGRWWRWSEITFVENVIVAVLKRRMLLCLIVRVPLSEDGCGDNKYACFFFSASNTDILRAVDRVSLCTVCKR